MVPPETAERGIQTIEPVDNTTIGVQTSDVQAEVRWIRLFHILRRISYRRRLRYTLTEYIRQYDGVYPQR